MDDQLSFDDLRAYQAGRLSGPAQHRVERILLEDPFYADALAGLEAMQQTATPTAEQLASLRNALQGRIHASATKKRLWPLWIATTTAAILFMLAMAIYFIFFVAKHPTRSKPAGKFRTTLRIEPLRPAAQPLAYFPFNSPVATQEKHLEKAENLVEKEHE